MFQEIQDFLLSMIKFFDIILWDTEKYHICNLNEETMQALAKQARRRS